MSTMSAELDTATKAETASIIVSMSLIRSWFNCASSRSCTATSCHNPQHVALCATDQKCNTMLRLRHVAAMRKTHLPKKQLATSPFHPYTRFCLRHILRKENQLVNEENHSKMKHEGNAGAHSLSLNLESLSQGHSATRVYVFAHGRAHKKHLNDFSDFAGTFVSLTKLHV